MLSAGMNWLAHLVLSEPDPEFRLGNLLPDFLAPRELHALPASFQRGIACHRVIDAFTDSHPVVRRSIRRLRREHQRYGGIIIDLAYDHFLACRWNDFAAGPLEQFAREFYAQIDFHRTVLPAEVLMALDRMRAEDWLCSYREVAGLSQTLRRVGHRFRRPVDLSQAMREIELHRADFDEDFLEFFPELRSRVAETP